MSNDIAKCVHIMCTYHGITMPNNVAMNLFYYRVPTFSQYQIPGFLNVFGPKFQFFQGFLYQIPGTSTQILVIKISKYVKTDVH